MTGIPLFEHDLYPKTGTHPDQIRGRLFRDHALAGSRRVDRTGAVGFLRSEDAAPARRRHVRREQ
jgi:hypothetical protein